MEIATILLISLGLAMDAFAVSLSIGTSDEIGSLRGKFRLAGHFGIFQSGMTALGWFAGGTVVNFVQGYDHWIALILLGYVGITLIRSGLGHEEKAFKQDPSTGRTLVMLSIATSIDAFAVGLTIGLLNIPLVFSILSIGFVSFGLSILGLLAGCKLGQSFGKKMEIIGGLILIFIGLEVVYSHLFGG